MVIVIITDILWIWLLMTDVRDERYESHRPHISYAVSNDCDHDSC